MDEQLSAGITSTVEDTPAEAPPTEGPPSTPEPPAPVSPPETPPEVFDRREFEAMMETLPPEAKAQNELLYTSLNKAFTQKTQALADQRQKVEFVDEFVAMYQKDPDTALGELYKQLGYKPKSVPNPAQKPPGEKDANWQPKTWNEVLDLATERAVTRMRGEMAPVMDKFQEMSSQTIEQKLNDIDPHWRKYEEEMRSNMTRYPEMVNNLPDLYRISVPAEVQDKLAMNAAMRKLDTERQAGRVSGSTAVPRAVDSDGDVNSFDDAVQLAYKKLKSGG